MLRLGVITSPGYRNLRGGLGRMREFIANHPELRHEEVATPAGVAAALARFESDGVDIVVVNGGDGTLSMVLTDLLRRHDETTMPHVAVLPAGRTNMSAGDVGIRGEPTKRLGQLIEWAEGSGRKHGIIERPMIRVESGDRPPLFGMFFGAALIPSACRGCWNIHASEVPGMNTALGTTLGVLKLLAKYLSGRRPFPPFPVRVRVDGVDLPERDWTVIIMGTLSRMVLRMTPWWDGGDGPIRFTGITHTHRRMVLAALFGALRGRANRFARRENGLLSISGTEFEFWLEEAILDGEIVTPPDDGPLRCRADGRVRFVVPARRGVASITPSELARSCPPNLASPADRAAI